MILPYNFPKIKKKKVFTILWDTLLILALQDSQLIIPLTSSSWILHRLRIDLDIQ